MECPLCLGPFSDHCGRCGWKPSDDVPEVDVREAKKLLDAGAVFVDVRTPGWTPDKQSDDLGDHLGFD